mmetsp:Transcript_9776/g.19864  ORF Transcript_9776/g.19864 Transcript_9776/m.19864 type:complete len:100 (+) Transcript_9776:1088-1387(+)
MIVVESFMWICEWKESVEMGRYHEQNVKFTLRCVKSENLTGWTWKQRTLHFKKTFNGGLNSNSMAPGHHTIIKATRKRSHQVQIAFAVVFAKEIRRWIP